MSQPPFQVVYSLGTGNATSLLNAAAAGTTNFTLATTVVGAHQQRLMITATGNEAANTFTITGTNETGVQIVENILGPNATTVATINDFRTVSAFISSANTAGTTSLGLFTTGDSPWYIANINVTPVNLGLNVTLQTGAATGTLQYTYDDPNNLPSGVTQPTTFNHSSFVNATGNLDGFIRDPVFAVRLSVTGGTGSFRLNIIQAGITQGG